MMRVNSRKEVMSLPRYTNPARKDIKWLRANLKTALLHKFTDMMVKGQEEELLSYQREVIKALAELGIFGQVHVAVKVSNWVREARTLVEIYRMVAPEGMGRETNAVEILIDELRVVVQSLREVSATTN